MMTNNEKHPFKSRGMKVRLKIENVILKGNREKTTLGTITTNGSIISYTFHLACLVIIIF
jgi:hypothetical protein